MMQEKDIRVIEKFKSLVSQKVKVLELRVFGSRARGDASPESDLDVLVVVDHLDYSPVAVSMDAVKHSPLSESVFIKNVYREGVAV
ncbi:MAG: nucleotidyltransferase domain-containing protein [Nitrospirae bacterium]|nr:nucleotidyltransferase domain-containing protein [Nitrospirota bacterium]